MKDSNTNLFHDVGEEYAREKVSHALRSRPNPERRRQCTAKKKQKMPNKSQMSEEEENLVQQLIEDQQKLLRELIEKEVFPAEESPHHLGGKQHA